MADREVDDPRTVVARRVFHYPAPDQGDALAFKFNKPRAYKYICPIHPKMTAAIAPL